MLKPLIITMGDPTGVGPEIIVRALAEGAFEGLAHPLIVAGDLDVLQRAVSVCGYEFRHRQGSSLPLATDELVIGGHLLPLRVLSRLDLVQQQFGKPEISSGRAMADYIQWACDACVAGNVAGMVTAPINKEVLLAAGVAFPGHTELLADRCQVGEVVMMLAGVENIREVIAFPMNQRAQDLMMSAPSEVSEHQLRELHLKLNLPKKKEEESTDASS